MKYAHCSKMTVAHQSYLIWLSSWLLLHVCNTAALELHCRKAWLQIEPHHWLGSLHCVPQLGSFQILLYSSTIWREFSSHCVCKCILKPRRYTQHDSWHCCMLVGQHQQISKASVGIILDTAALQYPCSCEQANLIFVILKQHHTRVVGLGSTLDQGWKVVVLRWYHMLRIQHSWDLGGML